MADWVTRYSRQILCEHIGLERQGAICQGTAAIVGLGALGSAAANMLARAGVGTLILIDHDRVELDNLQRQTLYDEANAAEAENKALAAARRLEAINSQVRLEAHPCRLDSSNAERLLAPAQVIVDGVDDFVTRYLLKDVACKLGIPYVYGAVLSSFGITMTILPGQTPCL